MFTERAKTIVLEENMYMNFHDNELEKVFLDIAKETVRKIGRLHLIQIKSICMSEGTTEKKTIHITG